MINLSCGAVALVACASQVGSLKMTLDQYNKPIEYKVADVSTPCFEEEKKPAKKVVSRPKMSAEERRLAYIKAQQEKSKVTVKPTPQLTIAQWCATKFHDEKNNTDTSNGQRLVSYLLPGERIIPSGVLAGIDIELVADWLFKEKSFNIDQVDIVEDGLFISVR